MKISLFYQNVTVLDYAYLDEHKGPIGHSQYVDVEFIGKTDKEGVVYDFSHAKKKVKEIIDRDCDHRFVVPAKTVQDDEGRSKFTYEYGYSDTPLEYWGPEEAFCAIPFDTVTDQTLTTYLEQVVMKEMPETVAAVKLTLRSEEDLDNSTYFHYTHGLKEHYGNCQRLIHGHRSTVKVLINGERDPEKEALLAQDYFSSNIHFCLWDNVVNKEEIMKNEGSNIIGRLEKTPLVHIKYTSNQGEFEAKIPGEIVYITPSETTVENLSIHFCQLIRDHHAEKGQNVQVLAYEGIGKGAISTMMC